MSKEIIVESVHNTKEKGIPANLFMIHIKGLTERPIKAYLKANDIVGILCYDLFKLLIPDVDTRKILLESMGEPSHNMFLTFEKNDRIITVK
jgi:hypothetical protein